MLKKLVFPGKYIQGAGALDELPSLIKLFGRQGLILFHGLDWLQTRRAIRCQNGIGGRL